ncbi:hypothetical protein J4Q44_G00175080 [Coregonus suidteri]|uniref:Uncharacterized protein n=1 Tax=Coregonus suidteri TaxID=861788 RepID=A0AAN8LLT1_9TELE
MDDQSALFEPLPPPDEAVGESQESLRDVVERMRSEIETQAKTIDSLCKTLFKHEAERTQILIPWQSFNPRCTIWLRITHPSDIQRQAAINHISQELYHSRRVLWEQIAELREEVHNIHGLLKKQRDETMRRLTEKYCKDMCLERMIDSCQMKDDTLRLQRPQDMLRSNARSDVSELQNKLQTITISKGKAPKKTGQRVMPANSDSDEGQSGTCSKGMTPKIKAEINVSARRK